MDASASSGRPVGLFGGRFRLGELLGVGGSSTVYAADDLARPGPDGQPSPVAIKVLHGHLAVQQEFRTAFLREAGQLAGLHHENVVAVHGWGTTGAEGEEIAWIALDRLAGPTLAEWVAAAGPLSVPDAVAVTTGLLAGLGAVHAVGLVHRDVSPGNVILAGAVPAAAAALDPSMVRLVDFGLAAAPGASTRGSDPLLAAGVDDPVGVVGNAAYLSPEQAAGAPVAAAGDLYQAGAVLYFLLTGQPPFPRASVGAVVRAHLGAPPPVPSALAPAARCLDPVVGRALAKQPERRFADADAFAAALQAAVLGKPPGPTRLIESDWVAPPGVAPSPTAGRTTVTAPAELPPAEPEPERVYSEPSTVMRVIMTMLAMLAVGSLVTALAAGTSGSVSSSASPSAVGSASASPSPSAAPSPSPSVVHEVGVPTLTGALDEARSRLAAVGLRLGTVRTVDSAETAGRVLRQAPTAGELALAGSRVALWVASGRNAVPVVAGLSARDAADALVAAGFRMADGTTDPTAAVTASQPVAGSRLPVGSAVLLVTTAGESSAPMVSPSPSISPGG